MLKLSGEAFAGGEQLGIDPAVVSLLADSIAEAVRGGVQVAVVVGGGNMFRGAAMSEKGMDRARADYMGMLGTVINCLALQDFLEKRGIDTRVQTAITMQQVAASGELAQHVAATLRVWVQGFALAAVVGIALGTLMGLFRPIQAMLATSVELLRPMPSVAIIPIAVVGFGLDDPMKRVVTMYAATWPILINTLYGVRAVDPILIDSARTLSTKRARWKAIWASLGL